MTCEETVIILDDDDDDVEFLGSTINNNEQPKVQRYSRNRLPCNVNGYTKPSIHYLKLITQALITCPDKKATCRKICEIIAQQHPYFQYCPDIWHTSIKTSLRRQKKFFHGVGVNENLEEVWSINPAFEKLMIKKWIPKYMQLKYLPHATVKPQRINKAPPGPYPVKVNAENVTPPSPVIVSFESLRPQSPVFVSSGKTELVNYEALIPETNIEEDEPNGGPEFVLEDPEGMSNPDRPTNNKQSWEPAATVSDYFSSVYSKPNAMHPSSEFNTSNNVSSYTSKTEDGHHNKSGLDTQKANMPYQIKNMSGSKSPHTTSTLSLGDFSLDNLLTRQINDEEIQYRLDFQKDHRNVDKFRLHCTVCDTHLGTSGLKAKFNVRFHSSLGVLVCTACYINTKPPTFEKSCLWCGQVDKVKYSCQVCTSLFCEACLRRNFGEQWYQHVFKNMFNYHNPRWKCLVCDLKQIWAHRAIAYFLYRHYRELKRKKLLHLPDKYSMFFKVDLSTCCKVSSSKVKANPPSFLPLTHSTSESSQTFIIGNQSPNQIYLNTPPAVSSVTLNTGTQYIHNVYPDRNYVFVQEGTSTVLNSDGKTLQTSTIPRSVTSNCPTESLGSSTNDLAFPTHSFSNLAVPDISTNKSNLKPPPPPPAAIPLNNAQVQVINPQSCSEPSQNLDTNLIGQEKANSQSRSSKSQVVVYSSSNNTVEPTSNVEGVKEAVPIIITANLQEDTNIIVPDNESPEVLSLDHKATETPILTARQMIERRPMPKSKKQSLLRTVLMNESIESMKRHLMIPQADVSCEVEVVTEEDCTVTPANPNPHSSSVSSEKQQQTVEEPILQSIIETATKHLFELKKKQNLLSSSSVNISDDTSVVTQDQASKLPSDTITCTMPKIKIRTLKELQDHNILNVSEQNNAKTITSEGETQETNNDADTVVQTEKGESADEVNVTPLKEGIIEACRTLLCTQRKFKELALLISCNLLYRREKAQDLVSKFQDILKSCQNQFDAIDKTVKKEFCHLMSSANMDSLLESIKNSSNESTNKTNLGIKYRKKKISQIHAKKIKVNSVPNSADEASQQMETNGCEDLHVVEERRDVDSDPTGIQSRSGPSNEDQSLISQHINKWKVLKAKKKPKRCMWNDKCRKRGQMSVRYKKDNSLKKRGRPRKRQIYEDIDEMDELSDLTLSEQQNSDKLQRLRKRIKKPTPPLRISGRRHPSSEEYIAQLMSFDTYSSEHYQINHLIKPCSVLLHRLDPRIVELLKWRAATVL